MKDLTPIFRSTKINRTNNKKTKDSTIPNFSSSSSPVAPSPPSINQRQTNPRNGEHNSKRKKMKVSVWSVYLIVSSHLPRTYVGVTTNFSRRIKQHNGELKRGSKASSVGRPWSLACIIRGFENRSQACEFESKWKNISRKLSRRKLEEAGVNSLLRHRDNALNRIETSYDSSFLTVEWQSNLS